MEMTLIERKFSADQRKAAAKSGASLPDGSYPIENKGDLENAIRAVGRASNPAAAKAHIKKRAKALSATAMLPDDWTESLQTKVGSLMYEADGTTQRAGSFDAVRSRVQDALNGAIAAGEDMDLDGDDDSGSYCWIMDIFPASVVYSMDGDLFQCDYQDDGELVTLGKPVEVESSYTEVPGDSTQDEAFSQYGSLKASAETPEEGKTHQALTERGYATSDLKSDGSSIWSKGDSTVHVRRDGSWIHGSSMGDSADSLTTHMDGTHQESLSLRESGSLEHRRRAVCADVQMLQEAAYDATKGLLTLTVIKPGFSKNSTRLKNGKEARRYYPADTLRRDFKVFEGAKMFVNHQTEKESRERPEGDLRDWGGSMKRVWVESNGAIRGEAAVIDPPLKAKLEELNKQGLLGEMGVSVRISAEVSEGQIENQPAVIIESLLHGRSVDFVTTGAAGGQVEMMEGDQGSDDDIDLVSEAELRQRRPDLVELIESNKGDFNRMKTLEVQLKEANDARTVAEARVKKLQETSDTQVEQINALTRKIDESDLAVKKATVQAEFTKLLSESKLPELARKRVVPQFADAVSTEGRKEAIAAEEGYIKSLGGTSRVTNMGEAHNRASLTEAERQAKRIEILKRSGMNEKEAIIAARGR